MGAVYDDLREQIYKLEATVLERNRRIAELEAALAESQCRWCEQLNLSKELYIVCTNHGLDVMRDAWKRATEKTIKPL